MAKTLGVDKLLLAAVGEKIDTFFGAAPASLYCVEAEKGFRVFRAVAYGVEVARVCVEKTPEGSIICEEL